MAGIYIHIPFCASRCKYCDFYSTTLLHRREAYVQAVIREAEQRIHRENAMSCAATNDAQRDRKRPFHREKGKYQTVYLGGGTPSMLTEEQIGRLTKAIGIRKGMEVTMEANPGDLTREKLQALRKAGINRLSIGIQSFNNELLQLIGRRHTAEEAEKAVRQAQDTGFDNISIDLIYGLPTQTMSLWKEDIAKALALQVQHISAYCLSYENDTAITRMLQAGTIQAIDDETENLMYETLVQTLQHNGYEHYEVSNFCLPGYESRHNSSYWDGTPYVGLGAAAHSYDGRKRRWNTADLEAYIDGIQRGEPIYEEETLTEDNRFNERIMLSLRTSKGLNLRELSEEDAAYCQETAQPWLAKGLLRREGDRLVASIAGSEILNSIIESFIRI